MISMPGGDAAPRRLIMLCFYSLLFEMIEFDTYLHPLGWGEASR
jgi:hypothetical protein